MNLNRFNILYAMNTTDNEVFNSFEEWDAVMIVNMSVIKYVSRY